MLSVLMYVCCPNIRDVEIGKSGVQGYRWSHCSSRPVFLSKNKERDNLKKQTNTEKHEIGSLWFNIKLVFKSLLYLSNTQNIM